MQPLCTAKMEMARDLLDYGVRIEGTEHLLSLQNCSSRLGCTHWDHCLRMIKEQWEGSKSMATPSSAR